MSPTCHTLPVVATNDEDKFVIWKVGFQVLERVPRIRRLGEGKLIIFCHETRLIGKSLLYQMVSLLGIGKSIANLERVLWTHHKPYLIETLVLKHPFAYGNVSVMNGIKRPPKKSYSHTINKRMLRSFIV